MILNSIARTSYSYHSSLVEMGTHRWDPPYHLGPPHGLLKLHQPLLVLIALHEHAGHLHPREAAALCHGDLVLQGRGAAFQPARGQLAGQADALKGQVTPCFLTGWSPGVG